MSALAVRRAVLAICLVGIAGMIVTSIMGSTGGAMTFGLVAAVAVLCSIVATSVTARSASLPAAGDVDALGARIEEQIAVLAAAGADERQVRSLVADAVRLGRATL